MEKIKVNKKKIILRVIFFMLLISTLIIIFGFSEQNGETSGSISRKIAETIINMFSKNNGASTEVIIQTERVVRKLAHFSIYALVGIWTMSFMLTFKISKKKMTFITIMTGFLYACSDEFHQKFVNGRAASFLDVIIDTLGVIFGLLLIVLIVKIYEKTHNKKDG